MTDNVNKYKYINKKSVVGIGLRTFYMLGEYSRQILRLCFTLRLQGTTAAEYFRETVRLCHAFVFGSYVMTDPHTSVACQVVEDMACCLLPIISSLSLSPSYSLFATLPYSLHPRSAGWKVAFNCPVCPSFFLSS
jgi:hypothetical protein